MCGIAGVVRLDGSQLGPQDRAALQGMAAALSHRGPDDEQFTQDGPAGLAFRRLSIVDVAGGRQPLRNEDGTVLLMANGEIFNHESIRGRLSARHAFRTKSDCEAILHLYEEEGTECLRGLTGMFAIAIWDNARQRLCLARDRFGIKPLFYSANRERIIFASELKALFQYPDCPRSLDWAAGLRDPLVSGALSTDLSDPASYFQGIEHLPAGSLLDVDVRRGVVERGRYWELPRVAEHSGGAHKAGTRELIRSYGELLGEAVRACLMSDVELGIFLSGGIDSAAVAALAAAAGARCHTFSVLSQSTLANGDAGAGHAVARSLGLPNHQVVFRWEQIPVAPDDWKALLWLCETPQCGAEQLYKFHLHRYAKATRPELKVMLTGQGSDEFNGGYSRQLAAENEQRWPGVVATFAGMERGRLLDACPSWLLRWELQFPRSPVSQAFLATCSGERAHESVWDAYIATKYRDLQMYNCWHEDRTAAGNSIENRVPFLDHRLVEFVLAVPPKLRSRLFWDKRVLREAVRGLLPPDIAKRPKGPFFYGPDQRFTHRMMLRVLTQEDGSLIEEAFSSGQAAEIIDRDAIAEAVHMMTDDPAPTNVELLLRLVNMGLLDSMARQAGPPARAGHTTTALSSIPVEDWDLDREAIELSLGVRREHVSLDAVPVLAPHVSLLRREGVDAGDAWFIAVDHHLEYSLSEAEAGAWLRVLRLIDGRRTLREALQVAEVTEAEVRKFLEEAVDFGVVLVSGPARCAVSVPLESPDR
jgi:asparagine synthase (glutamine-hydrolysing)